MKTIPGKTQLLKDAVLPVSVIIPCWKCEETIIRALESVVNQSRQPAEVIVVNDASGCATAMALAQIGDRFSRRFNGKIKVINSPTRTGPAGARNQGWQIASYPLLAFLDADDAWHFQKIEIQYAYMNANPDVVITGPSNSLAQTR